MGLTLREFCRRNGFDAGNISRIERGLAPPPQTRSILESYAKALKLQNGESKSFFELAAAETGRITDELLENQQMARKLPKLLQKLRPRRQTAWVTALHLESWADTLDARSTLPELIRRLVRATGKELRREEFPKGEQIQRPGWDGLVEAGDADLFVPAGTSGWEMGTDKNPKKKADQDFEERTKNPLGLEKKQTTFIFVTPRKWQTKAEWCRAKLALGVWKDVRVYDSATLEEWLEQSPAVDVWLGGILGAKPEGVSVLDEYWENLEAMTDPSLKPEVFLASREQQVKDLEKWLEGGSGAMLIDASSPAEAIDFIAAYSRDPSRAQLFESRALIVENSDGWRAIIALAEPGLILIPHPSFAIDPEMVAEAVRKGHRVVMPMGLAPREQATVIKLRRLYRYDLEKALQSSGLAEKKARNTARDAGGSVTVLKRLLGRLPGASQPPWSVPPTAPELVPLLLAGSWDESSEADRLALERLSGHPYNVVSKLADQWLKAYDPPLTRTLTRVGLTSRDDSWYLLGRFVSAESFQRFEDVACDVLAEDDPSFELPPEERWGAKLHMKVPRHSQALRNGLAETLALLGARPEQVSSLSALTARVDNIVRKLLDRQPWLRWASLSDQLPLLAEAAPQTFLNAVERDLGPTTSAVVQLFDEADSNALMRSRPYTGLLWAVELLAWDRAYLLPASLILAALDEMLPNVISGNNPARSLQEIFMPWFPQTTVSVDERLKVLQKLIQSRPEAGWRLLLSLIPHRQVVSTPTYVPSWRDWALVWSPGVTNAAYWRQVGASARMLIELLGRDVSKWSALIKELDNLPLEVQQEFIGRLERFAASGIDEDTRRTLSEALRQKLAWQRHFPQANSTMSAEVLTQLENVRACFEPTDPVRKNAWLFRPRWEVAESLGYLDQEERVDEMRQIALRDIFAQRGWPGILDLARAVEAADEVGLTFADISSGEAESGILPDLLASPEKQLARFAEGYVWRCSRKRGWNWVADLDTREWSTEEIGRLLVILPFQRQTWELTAEKGDAAAEWYWSHTPPHVCPDNREDATYAVTMLVKYKNPLVASHVLRMALHQKLSFEPSLLMDVLESWMAWAATLETPYHPNSSSHYNISFLFQELQSAATSRDERVDLQRLARLEWLFLDLLDGHPASPATLHSLLRDQPDFFVDVLGVVFRPKGQAKPERPSETDRRRAENAYRLLLHWRDVPGKEKDGTVNEQVLFNWIRAVRSLAGQRGLLEVADLRIGEVLAYAPGENDDSWPCVAVRDALEEIGTDEVFGGFGAGIYNKRGVVCKAPRDGGVQEWALAERLRKYAQACEIEWPKTAATLRQVAAGYEEEARREDAETEID